MALLRGINVGGNQKIKMAELKKLLEAAGLSRVQTYIQSGNVLFQSEKPAEALKILIAEEIKRSFGFSIAVMLRTSSEWRSILANCPYPADALTEGQSIQVTFFNDAPSVQELDRLSEVRSDMDEFQLLGKELYMFFRQSILDSKLPDQLQKLKIPVTTRNWNTVLKLAAMAEAMEAG
ncbi:DUF1697 domain-containing protein [Paenibacillus filicis]|uniref:DUF1697 domain-containing protein n=1 Tax=Paenibacillus gyeongsangnamensis TaxID=3388067 RepID=A0ABT4Q8B8_9BACL|nr:DUF1697 domain-containing protein [Paenibacillus filicis]MCZ8513037.1 DUF1697 domain-containing protein [Paenibacillus filicis]